MRNELKASPDEHIHVIALDSCDQFGGHNLLVVSWLCSYLQVPSRKSPISGDVVFKAGLGTAITQNWDLQQRNFSPLKNPW